MATQANTFFHGEAISAQKINDCLLEKTVYGGNDAFEDWHAHDYPSISLLVNGAYTEEIQGRNYQRIVGNLKYIEAGVTHRCRNYSANTRKINLTFSPFFLNELGMTEGSLKRLTDEPRRTKVSLLKLYHKLEYSRVSCADTLGAMFYDLFLSPSAPPRTKREKNLPLWAKRLREILEDEGHTPIHLEELARRVGVHPVTISRYFPVYFSATFTEFVQRIRIDKAMRTIKSTDASLTATAYACGFADQAHFTRTFKAITGFLPKQFSKL
ncbi:AraC family transcriptional regulator [Parapedobacter koreensis]|uniref:Transcriptional regulator, AraC family n=1 Tax=Parapedobacter koreensis TaxID=332977 RepID=A0A1H7Q6L3_9SPHI|nr:AraC family transcriptional regulator [Parapedobacter koreensis]SEL43801.1 transcriptional regulator, AraC family [Parapedobacter koreensis]